VSDRVMLEVATFATGYDPSLDKTPPGIFNGISTPLRACSIASIFEFRLGLVEINQHRRCAERNQRPSRR